MTPMKAPVMLYRQGTQERLHGVHVDWIIVDEHQVDEFLEQGWFLTPKEAGAGEQTAQAARRVAAEQAAREQQAREHQAREDADRRAALDEQEKRLVAMQEDLERRMAELERASAAAQKGVKKSDQAAGEK